MAPACVEETVLRTASIGENEGTALRAVAPEIPPGSPLESGLGSALESLAPVDCCVSYATTAGANPLSTPELRSDGINGEDDSALRAVSDASLKSVSRIQASAPHSWAPIQMCAIAVTLEWNSSGPSPPVRS